MLRKNFFLSSRMCRNTPGEALLQDCFNYTGPVTRKELRNHSALARQGNRLVRSDGVSLSRHRLWAALYLPNSPHLACCCCEGGITLSLKLLGLLFSEIITGAVCTSLLVVSLRGYILREIPSAGCIQRYVD